MLEHLEWPECFLKEKKHQILGVADSRVTSFWLFELLHELMQNCHQVVILFKCHSSLDNIVVGNPSWKTCPPPLTIPFYNNSEGVKVSLYTTLMKI